jgi:hypothetical protein
MYVYIYRERERIVRNFFEFYAGQNHLLSCWLLEIIFFHLAFASHYPVAMIEMENTVERESSGED